MLDLNKVMITGRLTRDPETVTLKTGTTGAKFAIASNRRWRDKAGEQQEEVSFFDTEAFGKTAEFAGQYLHKGSAIFIEGRLKQSRWETQDGQKRSKVVLMADRIQFAESKAEAEGGHTQVLPSADRKPAPEPEPEATQDDLPF